VNAKQKVIDRIGGERMVDLRERTGRARRQPDAPTIPGATDISAILGAGIYILLRRGEVVYIGKARSQLYAKIAAARSASRPKAIQIPAHDQVLIRPTHPDEIDEVYAALRAEFLPIAVPVVTPISIERRI
jgi:hypothetical protein